MMTHLDIKMCMSELALHSVGAEKERIASRHHTCTVHGNFKYQCTYVKEQNFLHEGHVP